jgi:hypothetical protein
MFERGQIVRHSRWGLGKVIECVGAERARVHFRDDSSVRLLDCPYLVAVDSPSEEFVPALSLLQPQPNVDMNKVRAACELFISRMEHRRPNCDDAGVARNILEELATHGILTPVTYKRLASWCHTDGSYREGIELAERISLAIYGRVIGLTDIG